MADNGTVDAPGAAAGANTAAAPSGHDAANKFQSAISQWRSMDTRRTLNLAARDG